MITDTTPHADVEHVWGTVVSVQTVGTPDPEAVAAFFADLHEIDRIFSPYRPDSEVSRIAEGQLALGDADPLVQEVAARCAAYEGETGGLFTAYWRGCFDPTGLVKGWAIDRAAARHLEPLVDGASVGAVGVDAGGDVLVFTHPDLDRTWHIGIADPRRRGAVVATVPLRNGAVATSGIAERGAHILDPRTGSAATGVASATVVASTLEIADVWATASVVAGFDAPLPPQGTVLLIAEDGRIRRGISGVEVSVGAAS
jgi:thiamine biosynthesis lipoprotein